MMMVYLYFFNPGIAYSDVEIAGGVLDLGHHLLVIEGNLIITGGSLDIRNGELLVKGKVDQSGGKIDLNYGTLTVEGDFLQSSGEMNVNRGKLKIKGNYEISNNSEIIMKNDKDYVYVEGDFEINLNDSTQARLEAGIMEIKGDFIDNKKTNYDTDRQGYIHELENFTATGTHRVILSGEEKQTVSFNYPGYSYFNILEITNSSEEGVEFLTEAYVIKELVATSSKIENSKNIVINGQVVISEEAKTGESNWKYDLSIYHWKLQRDQTIEGNVYECEENVYGGIIDLNNKTLNIHGNLIQEKGTINVNNGELRIQGNYEMSSFAGIFMTNDKDYVYVGGNFEINLNKIMPGQFDAGIMEIKGDFIVNKQVSDYTDALENFTPGRRHRVILSGERKQTVHFDYPGDSYFNILEITNSSAEGVEMATKVYVRRLINKGSNIINPENIILMEEEKAKGDLDGDGSIDSLDVTILKRYLLRKLTTLPVDEYCADVNDDGSIDSLDLTLLKRYVLRKIDKF